MGGVCGMGMAPLAAFLKEDGREVFGFDDTPNSGIKASLEKLGIGVSDKIESGRFFDLMVISSALARRKNEILKLYPDAKIIRRGECWAKLCENRRLTAVVGSHGKSTVSAMIAHASLKLNLDCGFLIGAVPNDFPMHRYCPEGEIVVSEIDESDGTIENFHPEVLVALNADLDHTDTYADYARLEDMFARLFARTKRKILYPARDKTLERIAGKYAARSRAVETPQDFMGANAAMALAALEKTFGKKFCPSVFESYKGLLRRQEILCDGAEIFAMADYAHHPTEIKSFIEWFLGRHPENPLIFFQPHRYTRTRRFAKDFAEILSEFSERATVALLPVYPASETYDANGSSRAIFDLCREGSIMLVKPEDFGNIIDAFKTKNAGAKINMAIVGAGDFYFEAKNYFLKQNEKASKNSRF